ncbi:tetratricopeptide repeat protein [candidate division WOR-3 bacterium]|nr:tetratricopeptide repeat protein [candidate division WOR-3 bacterium]
MYTFLACFLSLTVVKSPTDSFQVIEALFAREQYEEALGGYKGLIKFEDTAPEALYRMGECYYNLEQYEEAILVFKHLRETYTENYLCPEAIYSIGICWLVLGDTKQASHYLIDEIDEFPGYIDEKRILSGKGIALYAEGKYRDALIHLERLHTKEGLYYRGKCYAKLGDPLRAIGIYKQLMKKYPKTKIAEYAAFKMGDALFENKDYPGAAEKYQSFMDHYPWTELKDYARYKLGCCYLDQGQYEKAIQLFLYEIKAPDPWLCAHSWYQLGISRMKINRLEDAIKCYQRTKADHPDMRVAALAHVKYGQSYIQRGDTTGAQLSFQQVSSVYPTGNFAGLGDFLTGTAFYIQGRFVEAVEHYHKIIRLHPASEALLPAYAMMLYCYLQLGSFEEGASVGSSLYKIIRHEDPKEPWVGRAKLYLGELYYYLDRYPKAIDFYEEVIKDFLIPEVKAPAFIGKGWCMIEQGDTKEGHDILKDAYQRWSTTDTNWAVSSLYGWGVASFNGGDFEDAYNTFLFGVGDLYPECEVAGNAYYHGGKAIAALGKYGTAIEYWQKVLDEYPTCKVASNAAFDLGRVYFMAGQYDEAIGSYETILEDYPKSDIVREAQFQMGATYYSAQEYEDAVREFQKFIDLYPGDPLRDQARTQIQTVLYIWGQQDREVLVELIEKYPGSEFAAEAQWQIAAEIYNDEEYEEAIKEFQKLVVNFPESPKTAEAQYFIISAYGILEKYDKRIEECKRFLNYFPNDAKVPDVYFQMGATYFNIGRYVDAIGAFEVIIDNYKDYEKYNRAGYYLGISYKNLGEKKKSERLLEKFGEETKEAEE